MRALRNMTNVEALADFDQLVNTVRALYAPLERKQQRYGFSFEALVSSYRLGVAASTTDAAYRLLFEDFLAVLKDAHVSLSEGIADSALQPISLPFLAMPVEDTYVIASVYPDDSVPAVRSAWGRSYCGSPTSRLRMPCMRCSCTRACRMSLPPGTSPRAR